MLLARSDIDVYLTDVSRWHRKVTSTESLYSIVSDDDLHAAYRWSDATDKQCLREMRDQPVEHLAE